MLLPGSSRGRGIVDKSEAPWERGFFYRFRKLVRGPQWQSAHAEAGSPAKSDKS